ncbi:MAG: TIGR00159 family protein [Phycisphaerae bacterium]|nr:TIGR00159 family protein [Phycisphaerae bacterium]MBM92921.1 TIGR00159 family protein [Phycisphaerae bacterium]HCT46538.1 TIGR00159 family protein [Phycisphaerales bacterium]
MGSAERLQDLLNRLGSYNWWEVLIEFALIWLVVFAVLRFVQGTRAARALKGLLFILIVGTLFVRFFGDDLFARIAYLYDRVLAVIAIALVVIFQPELRRALIRLGETRFMHSGHEGAEKVAAELAPACVFLSKARFGAIVVIERRVGLKSLIEGGTVLNAVISAPLIQTIFHPGSALHDLAVVIRGDKVHSAGVQLPMASANEIEDQSLGSRHRAAIGVTRESDALVIVVSEETGKIRIAERGLLGSPIEPSMLQQVIEERLGHQPPEVEAAETGEDKEEANASGFADDAKIESGDEPEPEVSLLSKDEATQGQAKPKGKKGGDHE